MEIKRDASSRNWPLALALLSCYVLLAICGRYLLVNDELYYTSLSNQMSEGQIRELLDTSKKWLGLGYVVLLLFLLCKLLIVAAILALGYYALTGRWDFRPFFRTAIIAEFVMLVPGVLKIGWFGWLHSSYNLDDLQNFVPLSLSNLIQLDATENWLRYPLQIVSLFEVAYCLVLVLGAHQLAQLRWGQAARLVSFSYLPALLTWVVVVMFVFVSIS